MKQGRFLKLVNSTPYDWVKTTSHSYELLTFPLPDRVKADNTASIYVEWESEITEYQGYTIGEALYRLEGTSDTFQVQARGDNNLVILVVYCENLITDCTEVGEIIPLDLSPEGCAVFILSGSHGNYSLIDVDQEFFLKESQINYREKGTRKGLGILNTGYNSVNAYWEEETNSAANISDLHFPGDKKWESCLVEVRGIYNNQSFTIEIKEDGALIAKEEFSLKKDEIRVIEQKIEKVCSIDVTGQLKAPGFLKGGGYIYLTCTYDPSEQYKSETVTWNTTTQEVGHIDNLCLYGDKLWEKCEIYIKGYEKSETGCMLTLISNGEIQENGRILWTELIGSQSRTFSFQIHKKVSLLAVGYITSPAWTNARVTITLTGFYK